MCAPQDNMNEVRWVSVGYEEGLYKKKCLAVDGWLEVEN